MRVAILPIRVGGFVRKDAILKREPLSVGSILSIQRRVARRQSDAIKVSINASRRFDNLFLHTLRFSLLNNLQRYIYSIAFIIKSLCYSRIDNRLRT